MIVVQSNCESTKLEDTVDEDIRRFEAYFRSLGNDPLVRSERAIIKTYLHWKLKGGKTNG